MHNQHSQNSGKDISGYSNSGKYRKIITDSVGTGAIKLENYDRNFPENASMYNQFCFRLIFIRLIDVPGFLYISLRYIPECVRLYTCSSVTPEGQLTIEFLRHMCQRSQCNSWQVEGVQ